MTYGFVKTASVCDKEDIYRSYNQLEIRLCLTGLDNFMKTSSKRSDVIAIEICCRLIECDQLKNDDLVPVQPNSALRKK